MAMQRFLSGRLSAVMIWCSLATLAAGPAAASPPTAPKGWPARLGERKLHACEYGFVYAAEKSAVRQLQKVLATVAKDAKQDGVTTSGAGLILVVDTREKYPCEIPRLIEQLRKADPNLTTEESAQGLKAIADAEEQTRELGLDLSVMLSLAPIPVRPEVIHAVIEGMPADAGQPIRWCVICPTERCLKASFKKVFETALKKAKPSLAERAAIAVLKPLIERKAVQMMKKGRQAGFYSLLLDAQKDLSPQQRRQKIDAYREKLGLNEPFDPEKDRDATPEPEEDEEDSE